MSGPRILLVDDSLTVRMDVSEALELAGLSVQACGTAAAARAAIAGERFGLIILDVNLPDGDGLELLAELRATAATAAIPVMLLTSEVEVRARSRGLATGAAEYLGKPYDSAYLVARARELLGAPSAPPPGGDRATVLLVDDSPTVRAALRQALEQAGYAVCEAGSGEEGLRGAVAARPDAIIVDGLMPGMDGATFIRQLRFDGALRRIPCLLLTGAAEPQGELRALDAGADAYVRKEDDPGIVLARLAALLRGPRSALPGALSSVYGPKRVLAVDDSETYLNALGEQLRHEGYDVVLAHSGNEALQLVALQATDCILLDVVMPGLSGHQTCRQLKSASAWRDIPVVMLTSCEDREAMIEGINSGADDYIAKSADFDVLKARLRAQLRRRHYEDENRQIREQLLQRELEAAEARASRILAEVRAQLLADLEAKNAELAASNHELEAFSYSVSHDLRAPLRAVHGFSLAVLEDSGPALDPQGREHLREVVAAAERMEQLIDDMLGLARVTRSELRAREVDLSLLARQIAARLQAAHPGRQVSWVIAEQLTAQGDPGLLTVLLENLLGNAWKFTGRTAAPRIELGAEPGRGFFVRDNGAGFDMAFAAKLFRPFQRLHGTAEFEGTGIGLATVHRVVARHRGQVWAEASPGQGACFHFTLALDPGGPPAEQRLAAPSALRTF